MAESVATPQEIAQTVTTMHDAIVAAWMREEMPYSSLAEARTTTQWGMEIKADCHLTVTEEHLNQYRSLDAPLDAYTKNNKYRCLPLDLQLPGGRRGNFNLFVSSSAVELRDKYPSDRETLSEIGLLRLLGVSAPDEVLGYIQEAVDSKKATKTSVNRNITTALPIGNRWPGLHIQDTTTEEEGTHIQADILQYFETPLDVRHLKFKGLVIHEDAGTDLLDYSYSNTLPTPEITTLTSERLEQIGQLTLQTLDMVYGHGCYRQDFWKNTPRTEFLGLDGKPSEHAQFGYDLSRDTIALLR